MYPKLLRALAVAMIAVACAMFPLAFESAEHVTKLDGFRGDVEADFTAPIGIVVAVWAALQCLAAAVVIVYPVRATARAWLAAAIGSSLFAFAVFYADHIYRDYGIVFESRFVVHRHAAIYEVMQWGFLAGALLLVALPIVATFTDPPRDPIPRAMTTSSTR